MAGYGNVYHVGSEADEMEMLKQEQGLLWQAHPRAKGSSGYPDAIRTKDYFLSGRFLGGSFQSLPVDQSEERICEKRCLPLLDEMNNWTGPKYMIVKLDRVPRFDEDWSPILAAMRAGEFFVTSGEVLLGGVALEGNGASPAFAADVEWTFPLEFVELRLG